MSDPTIDDIDRVGLDLLERIWELTCSIEEGHVNGWKPLLVACDRELKTKLCCMSCGLIACKMLELESKIQELERINYRRYEAERYRQETQ